MTNTQANYYIFPGVVCVGVPTEITVIPRGEHARFDNSLPYKSWIDKRNAEYGEMYSDIFNNKTPRGLRIVPLEETELMVDSEKRSYYNTELIPNDDGSLKFTYAFPSEQEYDVQIIDRNTNRSVDLHVYAVKKDYFGKKAYRGNLHCHSYYSDGSESPLNVAASYLKHGFDFMALTDHFKGFSSELLCKALEGKSFGIKTMFGEEAHEPDHHDMHTINLNPECFSYNLYFQKHREECEAEISKICDGIKGGYPDFVKRSMAMRIFCSRKIHEHGGIVIMPHVYWRYERANYERTDVIDYTYDTKIYDAIEVIGGVDYSDNNLQALLYQEKRVQGADMPVVGSDDCHKTEPPYNFFGQGQTIALAPKNDTAHIYEAIKKHRTAAIMKFPDDTHQTVVAPLRLAKYVSFLMINYFPLHDEYCFELGRLLKDYACGDAEAEKLASKLVKRLDGFTKRYFG